MSGTETPDTGKFWILNLTYIPLYILIKRTHVKWKIFQILAGLGGVAEWGYGWLDIGEKLRPSSSGLRVCCAPASCLKNVFHSICLMHVKDNCVQSLDWSVTRQSQVHRCEEDLTHSHNHLGWDYQHQSAAGRWYVVVKAHALVCSSIIKEIHHACRSHQLTSPAFPSIWASCPPSQHCLSD